MGRSTTWSARVTVCSSGPPSICCPTWPRATRRPTSSRLRWGRRAAKCSIWAAAHRIYWAAQELQSLGEGNGRTTDTARHLLALILNELAHADLAAVHAGTELSIANVIYYMRHHLDRTETIEDLATRFFVSERHLYRMFEEELGCSPKQYWLRLRMERAAQLLRTTDASTGEIAAAVGFSSISGFERAFRRVMQRSTAEVRAQSVD